MIPNKDTVLQYIALLSQSGGLAPTAKEVKNNTGLTIGYTFNSAGLYNLTGAETIDWTKATVTIYNSGSENTLSGATDMIIQVSVDSSGNVFIATSIGGTPTDDILLNTKLELEIYDI